MKETHHLLNLPDKISCHVQAHTKTQRLQCRECIYPVLRVYMRSSFLREEDHLHHIRGVGWVLRWLIKSIFALEVLGQ